MSTADPILMDIPDFALIVLIGVHGCGKSTFAAQWFSPAEIISPEAATAHARDPYVDAAVLDAAIADAEERLRNRQLVVIDAPNIDAAARKPWIALARRWHASAVAIVLDPGLDICVARNAAKADRHIDPTLLRHMTQQMRQGLAKLRREAFRKVFRLSSTDAIDAVRVARHSLATDRRGETGPFDIIGDVHGCAEELAALLARLGYALRREGPSVQLAASHGRKLVFVGDLVDRGPRTPEVLRIAMAAQAAGLALVVLGNHDDKLARWLAGRNVKVAHGLESSVEQLSAEPQALRTEVKAFLETLSSHYWLDGGRLAVAHAGLKEEMIGRDSRAVREFALYGDTTGEVDEIGFPIRRDWARAYRGETAVIYGHTPVVKPEWVNNTLCVDTGCIFGGRLTALRWPEREIVSVPAATAYIRPRRPLTIGDRMAPD
jgi:protein phosphatase